MCGVCKVAIWSFRTEQSVFQAHRIYQQNAFAIISLKDRINKNVTAHEEAESAEISLFILAASLAVSAAPFIISP